MAALGSQNAIPIQYTQKARKPCQGPKSPRVHTYRPPAAPGYLTVSAATAMASGTTKNTDASSQSVMEPGPACAAAGIQSVLTMQVMAKRVTSRRPSSRRSAGAGVGSPTDLLFPQLLANSPQPLAEEFRFAAQPE